MDSRPKDLEVCPICGTKWHYSCGAFGTDADCPKCNLSEAAAHSVARGLTQATHGEFAPDPRPKDSLRTAQLEVMAVLRRRWRRDSRGLDTALRKWVKKLGRTT